MHLISVDRADYWLPRDSRGVTEIGADRKKEGIKKWYKETSRGRWYNYHLFLW